MSLARLAGNAACRRMDGSAPGLNNFLPLVEFKLKLVDKDRRELNLRSMVADGSDFCMAVRALAAQNGGIAISNREGNYIEKIVFPDLNNFTVEFPQFYRKEGLPFKIEDGKVRWLSLAESRVNGSTRAILRDDRQYTKDMPDGDVLSGMKKACGGCAGVKEEKEILTSSAFRLALMDPDTEFSFNPGNGRINIVSRDRSKDGNETHDFFFSPGAAFGMRPVMRALSDSVFPSMQSDTPIVQGNALSDAQILDGRDILRKVRAEAHERVGDIFSGYSEAYLSAIAAGAGQRDPVPKGSMPATSHAPGEESMLMRLLMNPVERKLWGKLYGLPDEDDARKAEPAANPIQIQMIKPVSEVVPITKGDDDKGGPPPMGARIGVLAKAGSNGVKRKTFDNGGSIMKFNVPETPPNEVPGAPVGVVNAKSIPHAVKSIPPAGKKDDGEGKKPFAGKARAKPPKAKIPAMPKLFSDWKEPNRLIGGDVADMKRKPSRRRKPLRPKKRHKAKIPRESRPLQKTISGQAKEKTTGRNRKNERYDAKSGIKSRMPLMDKEYCRKPGSRKTARKSGDDIPRMRNETPKARSPKPGNREHRIAVAELLTSRRARARSSSGRRAASGS